MTLSKAERNRKYEHSAKGRLARAKANQKFRSKNGKVVERQRIEVVKTDEQIIEAMELEMLEAQAERSDEPPSLEDEMDRAMMFGKKKE